MPDQIKPLRFTLEDARKAGDEWKFNCGPGALCAVLNKTPEEIRPHLLGFEAKGYVNPSLMAAILRGLGVDFRRKYECAVKVENRDPFHLFGKLGLARIQWGGAWTAPGANPKWAYRHTHWISYRQIPLDRDTLVQQIFDVNAMCVGGWIDYQRWADRLVPWLLKECVPGADGTWWPTHVWEIPS